MLHEWTGEDRRTFQSIERQISTLNRRMTAKGMSNPGKMARSFDRHRSTVETHLSVLLRTGIAEKVPLITSQDHLSISHRISGNAARLIAAIEEAV